VGGSGCNFAAARGRIEAEFHCNYLWNRVNIGFLVMISLTVHDATVAHEVFVGIHWIYWILTAERRVEDRAGDFDEVHHELVDRHSF